MALVLPTNGRNVRTPLPPNDPPTSADIYAASDYLNRIRFQALAANDMQARVTDEDIANAHEYLHCAIAKKVATAAAPPWFTPVQQQMNTMQQQMNTMQQQMITIQQENTITRQQLNTMQQQMNAMQGQLNDVKREQNIAYNFTAGPGWPYPYKIVPFPDGTLPNAQNLPPLTNIRVIRDLSSADTRKYYRLYGIKLPATTLDAQRLAIALHIGSTAPMLFVEDGDGDGAGAGAGAGAGDDDGDGDDDE
ncbi:hypothetical protein QCA50_007438 [Cerrena zonata]|uniref:Mug135-like C-terminal domain-containing protein n=1 Tax=Cerrena zonata TaxID=2478898 RepID=A0AAW0GET7_9APHY